jgi:hypothetical protein
MPAHPISRRRQRRFLLLIEAGASISEAARAAQVSRATVYRRAAMDLAFAHRLDLARVRLPGPPAVDDWRMIARRLEASDPLRWSLSGDSGAPFDAFDFDPLAP